MRVQEVYPAHIDRDRYTKALEQCVFVDNRLFNQSNMDVWFDIDGFEIKLPAGHQILCTDWELVRRYVADMENEEHYGCSVPVTRCGFKFVSGHKRYIYNDLVVFSPDSAHASGGYYGAAERTLEEHIALINTMKLEKATVIAGDLSFLPRCPSLKCLSIEHAAGQDKELDFAPLYQLPTVESLSIAAPDMGLGKGPGIHVDFTKLRGLRHVAVSTNDLFNCPMVPTLETLWISNDKQHADMGSLSCSSNLKKIDLLQCGMKRLEGVGKDPLQWLSLSYLRSMEDISALEDCAKTLRALSIDACGKIRDFSCLYKLENLEYLYLHGSNVLPNLSFVKSMPKLKVLNFSMMIEDGDLTPCLALPYATFSHGKRHYNLKDRDLPKSLDERGFELI